MQQHEQPKAKISPRQRLGLGIILGVALLLIFFSFLQIININAWTSIPIILGLVGLARENAKENVVNQSLANYFVLAALFIIGYFGLRTNDDLLAGMKNEYNRYHTALLSSTPANDSAKVNNVLRPASAKIVSLVLHNHRLQTLLPFYDYDVKLTEYADSCLNECLKNCAAAHLTDTLTQEEMPDTQAFKMPSNILRDINLHLSEIILRKKTGKIDWVKSKFNISDSTLVYARLKSSHGIFEKPIFIYWIKDFINDTQNTIPDFGGIDSVVIDPQTQKITEIYYQRI